MHALRILVLSLVGALLLAAPFQHSNGAMVLGGSPQASAFVPTDITGMTLWLKADAGAYKDAGTTLAANNETVQQWNDQSGSGHNASQATGANRPTYKTSIVGSQPVIRCDGAASFMATGNIFPTAGNPYTLVVVSVQRGASSGNLVSGASGHALLYNSTNFVNVYNGGQFQLTSTTATGVGTTAVHILQDAGRSNAFTGNTDSYNLTVNGNYNTGISTTDTNSDPALQLCALAGGFFANADLGEVILYTKILTLTDVNNITTYLNGRYATAISTWPIDKQIIFDGDSITSGFEGQPPWAMLTANHAAKYSVSLGSQSIRLSEMVTQAATAVDPLFVVGTTNVVTAFAGTNDIALGATGAATYAQLQTYCANRHTAGGMVVGIPIMPRGSDATFEIQRNIFNTSLASDTCVDAKVSTACSAEMWAPGAQNDATYFVSQLHPTAAGHAKLAACIEPAVDSL